MNTTLIKELEFRGWKVSQLAYDITLLEKEFNHTKKGSWKIKVFPKDVIQVIQGYNWPRYFGYCRNMADFTFIQENVIISNIWQK